MGNTYTTKEVALQNNIHVNTVRFYEEIGFITKPRRLPNGYRVYTELQCAQCALVRLAMRSEVLQNGLRKKAVELVRLCAALEFDAALSAAGEYRRMIDRETTGARAAIASVEKRLGERAPDRGGALKRRDAAKALGVTSETLRTWERSGLITPGRGANGYRVYSPGDMERLNIIRTLRCAGYSLSAILRLLSQLCGHTGISVEAVLDTPDANEDIVSVCDRLITSLQRTAADAVLIEEALRGLKEKYDTLQ